MMSWDKANEDGDKDNIVLVLNWIIFYAFTEW